VIHFGFFDAPNFIDNLVLVKIFIFFLGLFFFGLGIKAQTNLLKEISMKARMMSVDELGNVYVVHLNNALVRYSPTGDSNAFFLDIHNGDLTFIDVVNPLRILLYYPNFGRAVVLDRMLSVKNTLDLRSNSIATISSIASSADGNIWVYDRFNARLKKVDEQMREILQSNDLRMELQQVFNSNYMLEKNWKVYLLDSIKGIFVFDRYGNYIQQYQLPQIAKFQAVEQGIVYRKEDTLTTLHWDMIQETKMAIPKKESPIIDAQLSGDYLYVLHKDRLCIYLNKKN